MTLSPLLINEILGRNYMLDTSGLKLHLYKIYKIMRAGMLTANQRVIPGYEEVQAKNEKYILKNGAYIIRYKEYIRVPENAIALTIPRSSLLRMGATIHTAVWDPGYEGQGIGLLVVFNEKGIILSKGVHIAQLIFFKVIGESLKYNGIYKGEKDTT